MAISKQRLTLEEFLMLPEKEPALELIHGEVSQKVSPKGPHSALQFDVAERFNLFARRRKLARAFTELRTNFAGASPVPDVAVYLWDRIPRDDAGDVAEDFYEPPDIAIEILSPGQTVRDLIDRCAWYVENGVQVALLLHPRARWIMTFREGTRTEPLRGGDEIDLGDILPGFRLIVQDLFETLSMR